MNNPNQEHIYNIEDVDAYNDYYLIESSKHIFHTQFNNITPQELKINIKFLLRL
ncbi:8156_t:CDS:2 [Cetraspora pellucida]|uniref:8156_t:CDS:1 n=1 Tax=Cetraspora pellucida TaxID=1433469 RepID=A0A9N9CY28_9GLOM|nr:8156_t:CDS:2 [Cetraspora pellucida]